MGEDVVADVRGAAAPALVGRDGELALLADALEQPGGVRCVVVEGAAGIGKTALLRRFRAQTAPAGMLMATAEAEEALVDYALADQLLRAAGVERPQVIGAAPDLATVGLRLLEAFGAAAAGGREEADAAAGGRAGAAEPVSVIAVDDAQWADAASLRALLFALRRLAEEPLLLVLALREGMGERIPDGFLKLDDVRTIALGGLSSADAGAIAAAAGQTLSPTAARRLRDHAGGNPLYLRALLDELPASAWEAGDALQPAPALFARRVRRLLDGAPPPTRALVEAAAVLGARTELHAAAAVAGFDASGPSAPTGGAEAGAGGGAPGGGVGAALEALEQAQRLGLLTSEPAARTIAFDHPLTRAAVYHALGPARHAALHAAAAAQAELPGVALRHRAAAATGPDPGLAQELERFAQREVLRNAWESASESYLAAARLTAAGRERERLEVESADALLGAALAPAARARLGARADPGAEAAADARLLATLGYVALQEQRLGEAERLLALAWARDDADDPVRRKIAERRTVLALARLRPEEALIWARRVAPHVPAGPERELARWPEAIAHAAAGDPRAALEVLDHALTVGETIVSDFGLQAMRGRIRLAVDEVTGALEDLGAAAAAESRLGSESFQAAVHAWLAEALQASGAWEAAALEVERALALLPLADNTVTRMEVNRVAGALAVARGDLATAQQQVRQLRDAAANPRGAVVAAGAAAALAAAQGQPQRVLDELERFAVIDAAAPTAAASAGVDRPANRAAADRAAADRAAADRAAADRAAADRAAADRAAADLAEPRLPLLRGDALIRLGRLDEADAVLTEAEARAALVEVRSRQVALARLRGRLGAARGDHDAAERAFAAALAGAEALPLPYELALAQLDRGRWLRRQGQRQRGVALLELARDRFAALGAAPALEQCERELAASGLTPARRGDPDRTALTARERSVAQLAADGLTNREIAAELMVSVKTVEVHLSRVFAKLGIAARTELGPRL